MPIPAATCKASRLGLSLVLVAALMCAACSAALTPTYANRFIEPAEHGIRDVRVVLVLGRGWDGRDDDARKALMSVSSVWEREFGIRFRMVSMRWQKLPALTATGQVKKLRDELRVDVETDVVVLFSASSGLLNPEAAEVLGNYVVVAPGAWDSTEYLLHHGLGHIFGAGHSLTPNHVMSFYTVPFLSNEAIAGFSDSSKGTILANKWRSFDRGQTPRQAAIPRSRFY